MRGKAGLAGLAISAICLFSGVYEAGAISQNAVVAEVQVGGNGTGTTAQELVSIYNNAESALNITDWCIQYSPASNGETFTNLACFTAGDSNTSLWLPPKSYGVIAASEFMVLHPDYTVDASYNGAKISGTSGHIRLINGQQSEVDRVGYDGDAQPTTGALRPETNAALFTPNVTGNQVFQRLGSQIKQDTDNNYLDFSQLPMTSLPASAVYEETPVDICPNIDGLQINLPEGYTLDENGDCQVIIPDEEINSCEGIIISEVLPNPNGVDSGGEFIELHNPTLSSISLAGCNLETSASSSSFDFKTESLAAGQYKAYYDNETNLTLPNASGASVYLLDSDDSELDQVSYPGELGDDVAWALFPGGFSMTYTPTPNAANELLELQPCPSGQFRNPETNRCNNIVSNAASLIPCSPGKERNPVTNRCRNVASLASILKPCAANQTRNPETNRCKKTDSNGLKPCSDNQERNPETNRCRNQDSVLSGNDQNPVQDIPASGSTTQGLLLAAGSVIGALAYGVWEWRHEAILGFLSLKKKLLGIS